MARLILLLGGRLALAQEVCYAYDGIGRLIAARRETTGQPMSRAHRLRDVNRWARELVAAWD